MKKVFKKSELYTTYSKERMAKIAKSLNNEVRALYGQDFSHVAPPSVHIVDATLNSDLKPAESFAMWKKERLADGWTAGPYDQEAKKHPNLGVEKWEDLPFVERVKDFVFWVSIHSSADMISMVNANEGEG